MLTDNPYSTPIPDQTPNNLANESQLMAPKTLGAIAKPTFLAWERLRILFIVTMGLTTLLLVGTSITKVQTLTLIVEGAMVANVCFFAGPIVETYVRWLGYEKRWVRWFLFIGGTILTAILAIASLASQFLPSPEG